MSRSYGGLAYGGGVPLVLVTPVVNPPATQPIVTPEATVTIYTRDATLTRQGEVDDYDAFDALLQWNQPDTWTLTLPSTSPHVPVLTGFGGGIMVLDEMGGTVIAGPVTGWTRDWQASTDTLEVHGTDDSVWLERRLALPVPAGPPYRLDSDNRTGPAETVMRQYVAYNAAEQAAVARRVPGLTSGLTDDTALGPVVSGVARFDLLGDLLRSLAIAGGGLAFTVSATTTGGLTFTVTAPSDRSATVVLSPELGNILTYSYSVDAPKASYVIAGGQGDGATRVTSEAADAASLGAWGRVESFANSSKTLDADIAQDVAVELVKDRSAVSLSVTPIDTAGIAYGTDYHLGDTVTVIVDGSPVVGTLRQVKIALDASGKLITPVINPPDGSTGGPNDPNFFDDLRTLAARVALLERRT